MPNDQNESWNSEDYPFSSSFPAFTAINRRRRVTCRNCDLPLGYVDIGQAHLEAMRCHEGQKCWTTSDDPSTASVTIICPINVRLNSKRLGSCEIQGSGNHHMTWAVEDSVGNAFSADEIICNGCESSLGARIKSFERTSNSVGCQKEESQWYSFSLERVKVEPFFGLIGMRELSSIYYGGERYFNEVQAIEDSAIFSNNSKTWMKPHKRMNLRNNHQGEVPKHSWPILLMDLARANEMPEGTLGHLSVSERTLLDNLDAFTRPNPDQGIDDVSVTHPEKYCTENVKNAKMSKIE